MISVITPTCDRTDGLDLLIGYMQRQTLKPQEWIVCNGGKKLNKKAFKEIHDPKPAGCLNLANNILNGIEEAKGEIIIVMEDDDWYAPNHIETCVKYLLNHEATGDNNLNYHNVKYRCYRKMKNAGSALCQTSFRRSAIPKMKAAAEKAIKNKNYSVDGYFWAQYNNKDSMTHQERTVVGIKGLDDKGLGLGHRINAKWKPDPDLKQLTKWIGDDAFVYAQYLDDTITP